MDTKSVLENLEIGQRFESARIAAGMKEVELARLLNVSIANFFHYKNGREWGARTLAQAAVLCGKTPNDILLRTPPPVVSATQFEEFDEIDREHVSAALVDLAYLSGLTKQVRSTESFAKAIRAVADVYRQAEKREQEAMQPGPLGSSHIDEDGIQVIEPLKKRPTRMKRRNSDSGEFKIKAGEAPGKYGKKKEGM